MFRKIKSMLISLPVLFKSLTAGFLAPADGRNLRFFVLIVPLKGINLFLDRIDPQVGTFKCFS